MITLSSDFGSPYPAAMKGVILDRSDARLVDVSHQLPRQDVRVGAFWLRELLPSFPPAVHLVVVDPGVGTGRRVLVVEAGEHRLVGPDNGILAPVAETLSEEPVYYATAADEPASATFHGRDVFAPLAARVHEEGLSSVIETEGFDRVEDPVRIDFPAPSLGETEATGEVLAVDEFGNAITNVPGSFLDGIGDRILVDGRETPVVRSYGALPAGEPLVTVGSHGNVELAVNQGRGDRAFDVARGTTVYLAGIED